MSKNHFLTKRNEPVTINLYKDPKATGICENCEQETYETDDRTYHCHSMNKECYRVPIQESGAPRKSMPPLAKGTD